MKKRWLLALIINADSLVVDTRLSCLAVHSKADTEGYVVLNGPDEFEEIAERVGITTDTLHKGIDDAQKKQWLAPFTANEELQATTHLTIPDGAVKDLETQD